MQVDLKDLTYAFLRETWPELEFPLTEEEIARAIKEQQFNTVEYPGPYYGDVRWTRSDHVARVAYFCEFGWDQPIDVETHDSEGTRLVDGHHRASAAVFLGHKTIEARCVSNPGPG